MTKKLVQIRIQVCHETKIYLSVVFFCIRFLQSTLFVSLHDTQQPASSTWLLLLADFKGVGLPGIPITFQTPATPLFVVVPPAGFMRVEPLSRGIAAVLSEDHNAANATRSPRRGTCFLAPPPPSRRPAAPTTFTIPCHFTRLRGKNKKAGKKK